eukprot:16901-Heterococcus_DN1.PRE.1
MTDRMRLAVELTANRMQQCVRSSLSVLQCRRSDKASSRIWLKSNCDTGVRLRQATSVVRVVLLPSLKIAMLT